MDIIRWIEKNNFKGIDDNLAFDLEKLSDYNEDDNFLFPRKQLKPLELFWQNVDHQREMRNDDPHGWAFLFNPSIDEYVCAYNDLDTIDQKAITH